MNIFPEQGRGGVPRGKERDEGLNFRASLAPQSGRGASSSLQANMKIHVSMQQADMPSGLSQFLQLASRPHYEDVPSRERMINRKK